MDGLSREIAENFLIHPIKLAGCDVFAGKAAK